ncbi:MAG: NYN domain-containing protein [Thermoanaerobaculia bacterium]
MAAKRDRAFVFVDGNNWYHSLIENEISLELSYKAISEKIVGPARQWVGTRYYIGALKSHHWDYDQQRRFLSLLEAEDSRIGVRRGRVENQKTKNPVYGPALDLIGKYDADLHRDFRAELVQLLDSKKYVSRLKEKAADVYLAVDMCSLAQADEYDAAYLLSADGDFTPAVDFVKGLGKKVYAASPNKCYALGQACTFIPLKPEWFQDCGR